MHMLINDKLVCSSQAIYGTRNEGGEMGAMGGHSHGGMKKRDPQTPAAKSPKAAAPAKNPAPAAKAPAAKAPASQDQILTIASMSDCEGPWKVRKGDTVVLKAEYDLKKHPL